MIAAIVVAFIAGIGVGTMIGAALTDTANQERKQERRHYSSGRAAGDWRQR